MKSKIIKFLDIGIEYSTYVFIFFIPVSIAIVSVFACIAFGLFSIKQVLSPDLSIFRSNKIFFLILLIFFFFMTLSLINSGPLFAKSLKALLMKWGRFFFMLWMLLGTFRDSKRIVKAAGVLFFSAVLVLLSIISQKFFGLEFLRHKALVCGIITGPYPSQNDLAAFLTSVIPIVLCFGLWKFKQVSLRAGFLLVAMMLMVCSFLTYCRGGWVGLTAGLIWVALLINISRIPRKLFWTLISVGYALIVPLTAISLLFFHHRRSSGRFILARGAWHMIKEHPFLGKGLGTYMNNFVKYTNSAWVSYAHNCYLQIWAESGIFSLLSFLLLNGYLFYKTIKVASRMPASLNLYLLIGLSAGFLGILVHSFFDTQLYSFQASILFWALMGLVQANLISQIRP